MDLLPESQQELLLSAQPGRTLAEQMYATDTDPWLEYVKQNVNLVRGFEKSLAEESGGELPGWYAPFSLWSQYVDPFLELSDGFENYNQAVTQALNAPLVDYAPSPEAVQSLALKNKKEQKILEAKIERIEKERDLGIITSSQASDRISHYQGLLSDISSDDSMRYAETLYQGGRLTKDHELLWWEMSAWLEQLEGVDGNISADLVEIIAVSHVARALQVFLYEETKTPTREELQGTMQDSWGLVWINRGGGMGADNPPKHLKGFCDAVDGWIDHHFGWILGAHKSGRQESRILAQEWHKAKQTCSAAMPIQARSYE